MRRVSPILLLLAIFSNAQPLVHEEPHHIPIIENKHVRVLNVIAKRGDTTQFHIHENDIAYFTIRGSRILLQELNENPKVVELPTGWIGSNLTHSETPLIHRFANVGNDDFQLIAVEVLTRKFEGKEFLEMGNSLYQDERFSIQELNSGNVKFEVPWVLLELNGSGKINALDLIKQQHELELVPQSDSSKMIIIQFK